MRGRSVHWVSRSFPNAPSLFLIANQRRSIYIRQGALFFGIKTPKQSPPGNAISWLHIAEHPNWFWLFGRKNLIFCLRHFCDHSGAVYSFTFSLSKKRKDFLLAKHLIRLAGRVKSESELHSCFGNENFSSEAFFKNLKKPNVLSKGSWAKKKVVRNPFIDLFVFTKTFFTDHLYSSSLYAILSWQGFD